MWALVLGIGFFDIGFTKVGSSHGIDKSVIRLSRGIPLLSNSVTLISLCYLISLSLRFLIYKTGITIITLQDRINEKT